MTLRRACLWTLIGLGGLSTTLFASCLSSFFGDLLFSLGTGWVIDTVFDALGISGLAAGG